jgi:hypothetical protein
MSLLLRAAIVGGIAYFITRSLSSASRQQRSTNAEDLNEGASAPVGELHPGENNVWPTVERQPTVTSVGPTS